MSLLVFQLQATLAAWGDTAVGEYRPSYAHPGVSALAGLLGAALGLRRHDEEALLALRDGYRYGIGIQSAGSLLRDYHTIQVPSQATLKKRPHASRRDELAPARAELHTILSTRDYRQDAAWLVAVEALDAAPHSLHELAEALRQPRFTLYLGRKCCPPTAPLDPRVLAAPHLLAAFTAYLAEQRQRLEACSGHLKRPALAAPRALTHLAWSADMPSGLPADLTTTRKDWPLRRRGWLFGDRIEHLAQLPKEAPPCISA